MSLFRTYIIQWVTGALLLIGLGSHIAIPYSSQAQKISFAKWLDGNVLTGDLDQEKSIRDHIRQLPLQSESFDSFLQQASLLVATNQTDFGLKTAENPDDTGKLSQWLIAQWSVHQDASGSQDAVLPDTLHQTPKWLVQQHHLPFDRPAFFREIVQSFTRHLPDAFIYVIQRLPIPFLSGISINAP